MEASRRLWIRGLTHLLPHPHEEEIGEPHRQEFWKLVYHSQVITTMADSKLSSLALLLTKRLCTLTLDYNHVVKAYASSKIHFRLF